MKNYCLNPIEENLLNGFCRVEVLNLAIGMQYDIYTFCQCIIIDSESDKHLINNITNMSFQYKYYLAKNVDFLSMWILHAALCDHEHDLNRKLHIDTQYIQLINLFEDSSIQTCKLLLNPYCYDTNLSM